MASFMFPGRAGPVLGLTLCNGIPGESHHPPL